MTKLIDQNYVAKLVSEGTPISKIAPLVGLTRDLLSKRIKTWGLDKPPVDREAVCARIRAGESIKAIAQSYRINRSTLSQNIRSWGLNKRQILFNENFFEKIDSESTAYWLGLLMADGCVSRSHSDKVTLVTAARDLPHHLKWYKAINSSLKPHHRKDGAYQSQHYSKKMCDDLEKHGCVPVKSLTLKFPTISEQLLNHFVRGYFDGDGSIGIGNKKQRTPQLRISFIGTCDFLTSLSMILNVNNKLQPTGTHKRAMKLEVGGNKKARKIIEWLYQDATVWLERKREIYLAHLRLHLREMQETLLGAFKV